MNCAEVNGLLDLLMDGELTDEQRRAMEAHGRECPECAEAIRSTMQMKALFDKMGPEVDVPLEAQAKWRGAVKAEAAKQRKGRMIRWIASAAAAVVAVAGIGLAMNGRNAPEKGATLMAVEESSAESETTYSAGETQSEPVAVSNAAAIGMTLGESPSGAAYTVAESAGEAESYAAADNAVVEADGAIEAKAVDAESEADDMVSFEEADEELVCAAVAQRAPACELSIRVEDVETACDHIRDLVEEYEGAADVQSLADGSANVYIEIDADNAEDFLSAVLPMDLSDASAEPPELSDEGTLLLLLTVSR